MPVELRSALADSLDRLRSAKKCASKTVAKQISVLLNAREQVYEYSYEYDTYSRTSNSYLYTVHELTRPFLALLANLMFLEELFSPTKNEKKRP